VALGCVVNAPKTFVSIIGMEMNMVKINFPYTGHECTGIVEVLQHSFLTQQEMSSVVNLTPRPLYLLEKSHWYHSNWRMNGFQSRFEYS
jgi:hypothetical protein